MSSHSPLYGSMRPLSGSLGPRNGFGQEEVAKQEARTCALNCLAAAKTVIGDLNRISRIVRLTGYVCSADGFTNQAAVVNGASDFLEQALGEPGKHSRAAIGVYQLPLGVPVEVDMIVEVR